MIRTVLVLSVMAMGQVAGAGEPGVLKPVSPPADTLNWNDLDNPYTVLPSKLAWPVYGSPAYSRNFAKAQKGAGTVHEHAIVATALLGQMVGTAMPGQMEISLAIDAARPDAAAPDLVRIDATGKGNFEGAPTAPLVPQGARAEGPATYRIGPKAVDLKVGDRTVQATIVGEYYKYETYRYVRLLAFAAAEGDCAFGDKTHRVRVVDADANLRLGEAGSAVPDSYGYSPLKGDVVVVDTGEGKFQEKDLAVALLGQPVRVGSKWYEVKVSDDGSKVSAAPVDVATGKVRVSEPGWECLLAGSKYVVLLRGGGEAVEVPADTYKVPKFQGMATTEGKQQARYVCFGAAVDGRYKTFEVAAGKTADLGVGGPLAAGLLISRSGREIRFSLDLRDAAGSQVRSLSIPPKGLPDEPKITVLDEAGKTVYQASMGYG